MTFKTKASIASFGGKVLKLSHESKVLGCAMNVNVFLPPQASKGKVPVLYFLSGLTCTPDNCTEKGFFQAAASEHGIAIVYPDTSPRGESVPDVKDEDDIGVGAGFYINATTDPWSKHFSMYDYVVDELPKALYSSFSELDSSRVSVTGHSMGGHGALTLFLRNPDKYKSASALAPIANPSKCPWGTKAFKTYFGDDSSKWSEHDATELVKSFKGSSSTILIDVGGDDNQYHAKQLLPENFVEAAEAAGHKDLVKLNVRPGYNHSYFFVSSFASDHVAHAAKYLL